MLGNLLASGGGQHDQRIRLWDCKASGLERVSSVWTAAESKGKASAENAWAGQVTGLLWAEDGRAIMAAHGTQLSVNHWKPELKTEVIDAHEGRILCLSGCGRRVATFCAGDESLKFWEPKGWNAPRPSVASITWQTDMMSLR